MAKIQDFSHNFPGTDIDRAIFTVSGNPLVQANIGILGDEDALLVKQYYDLSNSYIFHQVEIEPDLIFIWSLEKDPRNKLGIIKVDSDLIFRIIKESVATDFVLQYNGPTHRWWRIRESYGTLYFDTSPDGRDWINNHNTPTPFTLTSVTITYRATGTTGWGSGPYGVNTWGGYSSHFGDGTMGGGKIGGGRGTARNRYHCAIGEDKYFANSNPADSIGCSFALCSKSADMAVGSRAVEWRT